MIGIHCATLCILQFVAIQMYIYSLVFRIEAKCCIVWQLIAIQIEDTFLDEIVHIVYNSV